MKQLFCNIYVPAMLIVDFVFILFNFCRNFCDVDV